MPGARQRCRPGGAAWQVADLPYAEAHGYARGVIEQLTIEGYRGFEKLSMEGLGRVNLLVGKNNSGKTSVLEAVRLLASGGGLTSMVEIAKRRREASYTPPTVDQPDDEVVVELSHFFHGRRPTAGDGFRIEESEQAAFFAVELTNEPEEAEIATRRRAGLADDAILHRIRSRTLGSEDVQSLLRATRPDASIRLRRGLWDPLSYGGLVTRSKGARPVLHVPPEGISARTMSELWAGRLLDGREDEVTRGVRRLMPTVRDLQVSGEIGTGGGIGDRTLVGLEGQQNRVPLGSLGEGVARVVGLSLALTSAKGGILLVDEIDTGLHHSVLADMWRLVMKSARQNDVQVFATTHSEDCLEALAEAAEATERKLLEDSQDQPAVFQIEAEYPEALRYDASGVRYALDTQLEIRGR